MEQVVGLAIENEMGQDDIEKLVDWVLGGNDPEDFVLEEEA